MKVLYEIGKTSLESLIDKDGFTGYGRLTPEEYNEKHGTKAVVMEFEDAVSLLDKAADEKFCTDWEEIDEDFYFHMFECLPPEAFARIGKASIWRLCEYMIDDITQHCVEYEGKYYGCNTRIGSYNNNMEVLFGRFMGWFVSQ